MTTPLFDPSLIPSSIALPEGYKIRPVQKADYTEFLDVLRVLTKVGDISKEAWDERYEYLAKRNDEYYIVCVTDPSGKVVGTGSLIVERKFLRNLGSVGHIEDIAVATDQQGKKLGQRIIETLDHIAEKVGCYKSILDCSEKNKGFYEKCGFTLAGIQMSHYYDGGKPKYAPTQ